LLMTGSQMTKFRSKIKARQITDEYPINYLMNLSRNREIVRWVLLCITGAVLSLGLNELSDLTLPLPVSIMLASLLISIAPLAVIMVVPSKNRLHAVVSVILLGFFFAIITFGQLGHVYIFSGRGTSAIFSWLIVMAPFYLLRVAPAKAVSRGLIFFALGLLFLIGLNELSKLVPKLQGWISGLT
jgi:hypothetical protein